MQASQPKGSTDLLETIDIEGLENAARYDDAGGSGGLEQGNNDAAALASPSAMPPTWSNTSLASAVSATEATSHVFAADVGVSLQNETVRRLYRGGSAPQVVKLTRVLHPMISRSLVD